MHIPFERVDIHLASVGLVDMHIHGGFLKRLAGGATGP
jgi:hypothetical protein